jgi:hypothetical protein
MQLDGWDWHPNNGFVLGAAYAMAAGQVMRIREYSVE